jgi:hypothetical protein
VYTMDHKSRVLNTHGVTFWRRVTGTTTQAANDKRTPSFTRQFSMAYSAQSAQKERMVMGHDHRLKPIDKYVTTRGEAVRGANS